MDSYHKNVEDQMENGMDKIILDSSFCFLFTIKESTDIKLLWLSEILKQD